MKKLGTAILFVLTSFAAVHAADEDTSKFAELTVEKARALAQTKGDLRLDSLTKISPEAINVLRARKDGNPLPANKFRQRTRNIVARG